MNCSHCEHPERLNGMKVRTDLDRDWTRAKVHEVITNEKYIGNNIYNRISFKLKKLWMISDQAVQWSFLDRQTRIRHQQPYSQDKQLLDAFLRAEEIVRNAKGAVKARKTLRNDPRAFQLLEL